MTSTRPSSQCRRFYFSAAVAPLTLFILAAGCSETVPSSESHRPPAETSAGAEKSAGSNRSLAGVSSDSKLGAPDAQRAIGPLGTAYYETSPAQGRPPDGELPPGTVVELLESAGSYSLVKWESKRGWVATDALNDFDPEPRKIHKIPMH